MATTNHLFLEEQLCFPIYATSRMVTRQYKPLLDSLDITYPQYIVLLALWEKDNVNVNRLCKLLYLNTNTITPLLKKLKQKGLLTKTRSELDEREVLISLTSKGKELKKHAKSIPSSLIETINMSLEELIQMRELMWKFLRSFDLKEKI